MTAVRNNDWYESELVCESRGALGFLTRVDYSKCDRKVNVNSGGSREKSKCRVQRLRKAPKLLVDSRSRQGYLSCARAARCAAFASVRWAKGNKDREDEKDIAGGMKKAEKESETATAPQNDGAAGVLGRVWP